MITKMTGTLTGVFDDEARLAIGSFEYQILVPEAVRRQLQLRAGAEVTFHISEYLEGNQSSSRFIPRKIGFLYESELEFFDLFCTVEKIGVKKALKAMCRPVKEIADAISRQDVKWLTTLPGIGAATAEQIVTTLKRKITKFTVDTAPQPEESLTEDTTEPNKPRRKVKAEQPENSALIATGKLIEEVYQSLMSLGLNPIEARAKLDSLLTAGKAFTNLQDALTIIFSKG